MNAHRVSHARAGSLASQWRGARIALGGLLALALVAPAGAETDLHGFVEAGYGVRTATNPQFEDQEDFTLNEVRGQLRLNHFGEIGEAFLRMDVLHDQVGETSTTELELREGYFRFSTFGDKLEVKAGRQALTWGTGDLIFINDMFPRDWVSFFSGRAMQYLRYPSDAIRLGIFGLPVNLDVVITPQFTPDNTPTGERFSFYMPPGVNQPIQRPSNTTGNSELALRLSRYVGNFDINGYFYTGFYNTPEGLEAGADTSGAPTLTPIYPRLNVYGASARGSFLSGVSNLEVGYYDSRNDRDGDNPLLPNSDFRYLLGYERQLFTDFNAGLQYYGEWMMNHDKYLEGLDMNGDGSPDPVFYAKDEVRHLVTLRLEKFMLYQTLRLSLFTYWSPNEEDVYSRGLISYQLSDEVNLAGGMNVFGGNDHRTMFGQHDKNDNVFIRMRYSF